MADELTTDERAELMALRAQNMGLKDNSATPVENGTTLPETHWLHLANGDVVKSNGVKSMHNGIQVIGAYEIPPVDDTSAEHVF